MNKLIAVIYTEDIPGTIEFYVSVLGFECSTYEPESGWARVQSGDVEIMVTLPNEHLEFEKPCFTGSFYIMTDDAEAIWNRIKDTARICYPLEDFEYGMREFALYDNNGYLVQFGQDIS